MCESFCSLGSNQKIFYEINYHNTIEGKNEIFKPREFLKKFYYDYYHNQIGNYNRDIFYYINDDLKPIFLKNKLCFDPPKNFGNFRYCTKANANTTYVNTIYNCTDCSNNFLSYNSEFFGRKICQNVFDKIITEKEISLAKFEDAEYIKANEDGTCIKKNMFSPDGKKCYQCDDQNIGMPGCKGACNFSTKRNDLITCEDGCKVGYIEVKKGICEPCDIVNEGCLECHYEDDNNRTNYPKIKKERKFICDFCETGFYKLDGKCVTCEEDLSLYGCEECDVDPHNNNEYICTKCKNEYCFLNGHCYEIFSDSFFKKNNNCYICKDMRMEELKIVQFVKITLIMI